MTGTSLVVTRRDLDQLAELGHALRDSGYFEDGMSIAQAAVKVLAGRELGLGPVASMRLLHIVEGKIEMSADLLAMRVKQHERYDYRVREITADACVLVFFEDGEPVGTSEFTMGDAENAQLLGRKSRTWERYPRNMLFNRALTNGVAWFCPDVAAGGSFVVEGAVTTDPVTGEIVEASDSLEPLATSGPNHIARDGMGETDGGDTNQTSQAGAVTPPNREESLTDESPAYGEGAGGTDVGDSSRHVAGTSAPSHADESGLPPGTEGASVSADDLPDRAEGDQTTSADAEGVRTLSDASADDAKPPPSATRALSSQVSQLLRHALAMRWTDVAIAREVDIAYPGAESLSDLTQEQARELIPIWGKFVRDSRMTKDQQDALKPLCTIRDAKAAAETLFGFKVSSLGELTKDEGDALIRKIGEVRAEQARAGVA